MGLRGGMVVCQRKDEMRVTKEAWREEETMVMKVAIRLTTRVANQLNGKEDGTWMTEQLNSEGRTRLGGRVQWAIVF